jgi:hypothetical protein
MSSNPRYRSPSCGHRPRALSCPISTTASRISRSQALLEEATGSLSRDSNALGQFLEYPLLTVVVTPAEPKDFIVSVDGESYRAGARAIRVKIGEKNVVVSRANKPRCTQKIVVTVTGPNQVTCAM